MSWDLLWDSDKKKVEEIKFEPTPPAHYMPAAVIHITARASKHAVLCASPRAVTLIHHTQWPGGWKWNRGLGNKSLTSKRHYMYQRLDGEASISCHWQQVSRHSQVIWSPWLRHRPITGRLFQIVLTTRGGSWMQVTAGVLTFVQKIYRVTSVFLCGVSFISFVESQFLVYV